MRFHPLKAQVDIGLFPTALLKVLALDYLHENALNRNIDFLDVIRLRFATHVAHMSSAE